MSASDMYFWWILWLSFAGVITMVAAALLLTVIGLAHRIVNLTGVALAVVGEIEGNTGAIWELTTTNKVANQLAVGSGAIAENTETIASVLGGPPGQQVQGG